MPPPIFATWWTEKGNNEAIITVTPDEVHDIEEISQRLQNRSPIMMRTVCPALRAMVEDEGWYDQPDEVRETVHKFYRLIRV